MEIEPKSDTQPSQSKAMPINLVYFLSASYRWREGLPSNMEGDSQMGDCLTALIGIA